MGVGLAFCLSAAVGYCALKCKDHFGRYQIQKEEERSKSTFRRMSGVYHITTDDFEPTVQKPLNGSVTEIRESSPKHRRPGLPEGRPPDVMGHKAAGSDSSREIILDIEIHSALDSGKTRSSANRESRDSKSANGIAATNSPMIVVTNADCQYVTDMHAVELISNSESDEGICLDQDCANASKTEFDGDRISLV